MRGDKGDSRAIEQIEVAERVLGYCAETVSCPVLRVVANVSAVGGELPLARHDLVPVVELPKMVADVVDLARAAHLAVDIAGAALETAKEKAEVMLFVRRPEPDSHNRMEVVGHYDKLVKLELWVLRWHLAPVFLDPAPELVQFAAVVHDCTENRLIVRSLPCDEEPAVAIVDVCVAQRLVEARHICRAHVARAHLVSRRSHAHADIIPQFLPSRPYRSGGL